MCSKGSVSPTAEDLNVKEQEVAEPPTKEKKKKKHKEKRKRSCSTDSTSSASSHKRHKKKKKKKKKDEDPPSPRVNPIFLWVKQDHTKIVEVLCEDYDKRNRIRLTKTPGGWVAIPRTARLCPMAAKEEEAHKEASPSVEQEEEEEDDDDVKVIEVEKEEPVIIELDDSDEEENKETECTDNKCCADSNVDENHNNEVDRPVECNDYCVVEDDHDEDIEEEVDKDTLQDAGCTKSHQENCENLMNELADMCFPDNFKEEEDAVLEDIYTFVPSSPEIEKEEIKNYVPVHDIKKPATPDPVPINLVVHSDREHVETKVLKEEPLKQSELESLDILWRLPEGTTISHSKPLVDIKPSEQRCTPQPKLQPTFCFPVQEEPLNLGKPKPKEEKKKKTKEESKLMELLKTEERPPSNALDQLKEVLSDPDLSVPDPLLVPRGRLPALIANPAKEIPRLLAQKREIKYPKIDADLMVVSLSHLQSILQRSGGEEDLKPYGQQMVNFSPEMDPATLNQMLWLPYLSQLEMKQNQELMTMLSYPTYVYPQQYTPPPPRYPNYGRQSWPRPETSKPSLPVPKDTPREPKQKLRLKVKDHLIDPNFKRTSLLNLDPPPFMPPVGVPPNSNLWHPLFSRNARLEMRRFSPKSARTASTRAAGIGRLQ